MTGRLPIRDTRAHLSGDGVTDERNDCGRDYRRRYRRSANAAPAGGADAVCGHDTALRGLGGIVVGLRHAVFGARSELRGLSRRAAHRRHRLQRRAQLYGAGDADGDRICACLAARAFARDDLAGAYRHRPRTRLWPEILSGIRLHPSRPDRTCRADELESLAWMPGIADKFTQSAQGRLLCPGMTKVARVGLTLLLADLEWRLLAGRRGFLGHRQHHRDHDVVARHRRQIHDLLVVENLPRPRIGLVGNLLRGGELGDEVVDHRLVLGHAGRTLAGFEFGDDLWRQARLRRQRRVRVPLDLRAPLPPDDQNRELVEFCWH